MKQASESSKKHYWTELLVFNQTETDWGTREQNEKKFGAWTELPGGGRLYRLEIAGRFGWRSCYFKEVDSNEITVRFWQEI